MEKNYKHIDLGYEFWDRGYMFHNSIANERKAYDLWVEANENGSIRTVDEFLNWMLENNPDMIYNYREEDQRYREENEPKIRAFFEKNLEGKSWEDIDPDLWECYSDWHKDVFGYRPHAIVCGAYVNPHR